MSKEQKIIKLLFGIYVILVSWIILLKLQFSPDLLPHIRSINFIPFGASVMVNGKVYWSEIINNVIIFLPIGIYLKMLRPNWSMRKSIVPILGLSIFYEIIQFIFAIGTSDITDLLTNTSGGILGIFVYLLFQKILGKRTNKILTILAAICTLLVIALLSLLIVINY
jgi:glycopeptide antibiotics resistance protein